MYFVFRAISLFAQQARFDRGMTIFKWGVTGVGVAVLILAVAVVLSKKPASDSKELAPTTKRIVGIVLGVIGLGIIAFAWLAF